MRFDFDRMKLESTYQDAILEEAKNIKVVFEKLTGQGEQPVITL